MILDRHRVFVLARMLWRKRMNQSTPRLSCDDVAKAEVSCLSCDDRLTLHYGPPKVGYPLIARIVPDNPDFGDVTEIGGQGRHKRRDLRGLCDWGR